MLTSLTECVLDIFDELLLGLFVLEALRARNVRENQKRERAILEETGAKSLRCDLKRNRKTHIRNRRIAANAIPCRTTRIEHLGGWKLLPVSPKRHAPCISILLDA